MGVDVGISDVAGSDSTEEDVINSTDEALFSAFSLLSYSLNIYWDSSCARRMEEVCKAVAAEVIVAVAPRFGGGTKRVANRVAKTFSKRVRWMRPSVPYPKLDWMDAAFELRNLWISWMEE